MRKWLVLFLLLVLLTGSFAAFGQGIVRRPPDTGRNLERLANTMGALHYLKVVCDGRGTQDWRDRMVELLELENPNYRFRAALVGAFNDGYSEQQRKFPACVPQISGQMAIKAQQGRILSDALVDPYLQ